MLALLFAVRLVTGADRTQRNGVGGSDAMQNGMLALFSMSGDAAADVAPGRSDRMNTGPAENRRSTPPPTPSGAEPSPAQ